MAHVVYLKDRLGIHDRRFVDALREGGYTVTAATWRERDGWRFTDGGVTTTLGLLDLGPDVLQVGPLPVAAQVVPLLGSVPTMAVCWGSDAYGPIGDDERAVLAGSAAVLCDCTHIGRRLIEHGADPARVVCFAWGIDLGLFRRPPGHDLQHRGECFVTTRSLEPLYDNATVLRALSLAGGRAAGTRLRVYGDGSEKAELAALARELCVSERVDFLDPVAEDELADVFLGATAWINAARSDGTCISLLQALACGCGVVTTDLECAREAVGPASALFFPAGDAAALARQMETARPLSQEEYEDVRRWLAEFADWRENRLRYLEAVERLHR